MQAHKPQLSSQRHDAMRMWSYFVQVDLVMWGHVHNYERTCAVYQSNCLGSPTKNKAGIDTYNSAQYTAPVHSVIGMAGFSLDAISAHVRSAHMKGKFKQISPNCLINQPLLFSSEYFRCINLQQKTCSNCSEIYKEKEFVHLLQRCSRDLITCLSVPMAASSLECGARL